MTERAYSASLIQNPSHYLKQYTLGIRKQGSTLFESLSKKGGGM